MPSTTVATAQLRNQLDALPVVTGLVAFAAVTTDGTGVAVNFATNFYTKAGQTSLASKQLRMLVINNCGNANAVKVQIDGVTLAAAAVPWIWVPGRSMRELPGYQTACTLTIHQGDTTAGVVMLEAYVDGSYTP